MTQAERQKNWHTPDIGSDLNPIEPIGQMLVGRDIPATLRFFSVRQRESGVSLSLYSRKKNHGVPAYGITASPEVMLKISKALQEEAIKVLKRQGKRIDI